MSSVETATRSRTLEWSDPVATAAAGAELAGLDYMRTMVAGELPRPPISLMMNMRPTELEEGRVVFAGEPGGEARLTAEESGKLLATGTSTLMIFGG
jgi:hypothetical protein